MTVKADSDCYFKVVHIYDNQAITIYPNRNDRDNYLKANVSRSILENARYYLYEPYGIETIYILASTEQFDNLEQELISPWTAITTETIVPGRRDPGGGALELENNSQRGEARYSINILKPDEEYESQRPENLTLMYQTLRNDTLKKGGVFEGNETSGVYIVGNTRKSYRIPREAPDTIRFATYYLDNSIEEEEEQRIGSAWKF
jgi:hypothetical protein